MKSVYDNLSISISKLTTRVYSTSFSMGIYLLERRLRDAIYAIYGFVRVADEIVDSFEGYDRKQLLEKFRHDTAEAIAGRISTNPILNAFQETVHRFNIDGALIDCFLNSMEMDLGKVAYTKGKYELYIYGSAEVVGLMCLHVFTNGNREEYEILKPYAMRLGAAFQKVNFLRDLKADYHILGRSYFPNVDLGQFTAEAKKEIETDIEDDFAIALTGIKRLPASSKAGVYVAYRYYRSLFNKIKRMPPHRMLIGRLRINNGRKITILIHSLLKSKMNLI